MSNELDFLGDLDPDDSRQSSQQIAQKLRAAILTGRFGPGDKLPSQPDLAAHFGVARETIKRAMDHLRGDKLIVSRQGSGVFVRAQTQRPVELRPHIEAAFEEANVTIDFAGFAGETLRDAVTEALDKVRAGNLAPQSITVRLLISDMSVPMALPARADTQDDDPRVRARMERITRRSVDGLLDQVRELGDLGLVPSVTIEARTLATAPTFKLYLINGIEAFYGFYFAEERTVTIQGEPVQIYDAMGKDVPLIHFTTGDDPSTTGNAFVESSRLWFETTWATVARAYQEQA